MTIKQLSIFMENRSGALLRVLEMLRDNGISIVVSTLGDTDGFGIYRVICNDTEKAFKLLRNNNQRLCHPTRKQPTRCGGGNSGEDNQGGSDNKIYVLLHVWRQRHRGAES